MAVLISTMQLITSLVPLLDHLHSTISLNKKTWNSWKKHNELTQLCFKILWLFFHFSLIHKTNMFYLFNKFFMCFFFILIMCINLTHILLNSCCEIKKIRHFSNIQLSQSLTIFFNNDLLLFFKHHNMPLDKESSAMAPTSETNKCFAIL